MAKISSRTGRFFVFFPHNLTFCFPHKFSIQIPNFVIKNSSWIQVLKKCVHQFLLNFNFYLRSVGVHGHHVQDILTPNFKKILLLSRCNGNFFYSCYKCADISCFKIYNSYFWNKYNNSLRVSKKNEFKCRARMVLYVTGESVYKGWNFFYEIFIIRKGVVPDNNMGSNT